MASANRSNPYQPAQSGSLLGLFDRLFVSTPAYRGDGQPQPQPQGRGLLGGLGGLLGLTAPVYKTALATPTVPPSTSKQGEHAQDDAFDSFTDSEPGCMPGCDGPPLTIVIARD